MNLEFAAQTSKASAKGACFVCVADPTAQEPSQSGVSFCKEIYQLCGLRSRPHCE
jgi:hypothetical protein